MADDDGVSHDTADHRQPKQVPLSLPTRSAAAWRSVRSHPGRITTGALLASIIGHLLILSLAPRWKLEIAANVQPRSSGASLASQRVQVVVLAPRRSTPPAEPPEVAAIATSVAPAEIDLPGDSTAGAAVDTAGEKPRGRNPLIWEGFSDQRFATGLLPLTPEEALAEALSQPKGYVSPLRQCYDSIDARVARARRAQDLSVTDGRGWRWGLSADGIHLGPVTVPIRSGQDGSAEGSWRPPRDPCVDD